MIYPCQCGSHVHLTKLLNHGPGFTWDQWIIEMDCLVLNGACGIQICTYDKYTSKII